MKSKLAYLSQYPAPIRLLAFLGLLLLFWLPVAIPIAVWVGDRNWLTILTMAALFGLFLVLIRAWGRWLYQDPYILHRYGLVIQRQTGIELLEGLGLGLACILLLLLLQSLFGWITWQPSLALLRVGLEGLLVGLLVGLAEELVFRGWLLDELQRDYSPNAALIATSLLYAIAHFIKPLPEIWRTLPQFPGLILLGLILVWAKRSTQSKRRSTKSLITHQGRLGLPIGLHAGLVCGYYIVDVGQLVRTNQASSWLTGVDQNPLAGIVGLLLLAGLAAYFQRRSYRARFS